MPAKGSLKSNTTKLAPVVAVQTKTNTSYPVIRAKGIVIKHDQNPEPVSQTMYDNIQSFHRHVVKTMTDRGLMTAADDIHL